MNPFSLVHFLVSVLLQPMSYTPPTNQVLFIYGLTSPATLVPKEFARESVRVVECESTWDPDKVNLTSGTRGLFQMHPIHRVEMRRLDLDYDSERDRIRFAVVLWQRSEWQPWSCKP